MYIYMKLFKVMKNREHAMALSTSTFANLLYFKLAKRQSRHGYCMFLNFPRPMKYLDKINRNDLWYIYTRPLREKSSRNQVKFVVPYMKQDERTFAVKTNRRVTIKL